MAPKRPTETPKAAGKKPKVFDWNKKREEATDKVGNKAFSKRRA